MSNRSEYIANLALMGAMNAETMADKRTASTAGANWATPAPKREAQAKQRQRRFAARAESSIRALFRFGK